VLLVLAVESVLAMNRGSILGPAEAKRPRFAPGFYEPLHGLNAALYDALESAAAEQQAVILAGWDKFACSELLNIFMDCLTDEVKADKTRLNTVLLHFLERDSSNDLDLSPLRSNILYVTAVFWTISVPL
jgi:hypothetical protein